MIGVELVESSRKPLAGPIVDSIVEECKDLGVLIGKGGVNGNVSSWSSYIINNRVNNTIIFYN